MSSALIPLAEVLMQQRSLIVSWLTFYYIS